MRHPTIKYTLWFILLTTFLLATFQPVLLEVAHRVAHLGEATEHHHFHNHGIDHTHTHLTQFANTSAPLNDTNAPLTTTDFSLKTLLAIVPTILQPTLAIASEKTPILTFTNPLHSIFLACESPPPDHFFFGG